MAALALPQGPRSSKLRICAGICRRRARHPGRDGSRCPGGARRRRNRSLARPRGGSAAQGRTLERQFGRARGGGRLRRRFRGPLQRLQDRSRQARHRPRAAPSRNDGDLTMSMAAPEPKANMGQPVPRYDALAKVTGQARYAADMPLMNPAYAYLVTSAIARGRIDGFDLTDAGGVRGVIDIVTHENADKLKPVKL